MKRRVLACLAGWLMLSGCCSVGQSQTGPYSEYEVKAAFIYNFFKFVSWPEGSIDADGSSPLVVGILGENPFNGTLVNVLKSRQINDRPIEVKQSVSLAEATDCHLLFVSDSEKDRLREIIDALRGSAVLTVGETSGFAKGGGIIEFFLRNNKVAFEINPGAAKRAGLEISSQLLRLARIRQSARDPS